MEDASKHEILEAIKKLSGHQQEMSVQLKDLSDRQEETTEAMHAFSDRMDDRFAGVENRLTRVETDITGIKASMVTKSYLDDKLADLRGDMVKFVRDEDAKILAKLG